MTIGDLLQRLFPDETLNWDPELLGLRLDSPLGHDLSVVCWQVAALYHAMNSHPNIRSHLTLALKLHLEIGLWG